MPCERPIRAYRAATGGPLRFTPPDPGKDPRQYTALDLPCGTCLLCRNEQARQWAVRIAHEATLWEENSFLTLTYADNKLPTHGSLNYPDLAKFWKRLRKRIGPLRYYAVGEYGDKTLRPHYHACLFGHDFMQGAVLVQEQPYRLWENAWLNQAWGLGRVTVGALTFETARYTASYVTKKLKSQQKYVRVDEQTGELIPITQPRPFMSRNIGKEWWVEWGQQIVDHDYVVIQGTRHKPPKAYDRWLGEVDQEQLETIKDRRKANAETLTQDQTRARARNARAHAEKKSKKV